MKLKEQINALKPEELGVGDAIREKLSKEPCKMYRVKRNENSDCSRRTILWKSNTP